MTNVITILWDLGGTLVDSRTIDERALFKALRELGVRPRPELLNLLHGFDATATHRWCRDELGLDLGLSDWLRLLHRSYLEEIDVIESREGAVELFVDLERHGLQQAVVSNSGRLIVEAMLNQVRLNAPMRISVSRNDVRVGKPKPEPYLRAAWLLGTDPDHCVVVENSRPGAQSALAAGMRTVFWPSEESWPTPKGAERVNTYAELERKLRAA